MINLYDILDTADGQLFGEPIAQLFNGFCVDHRQAQPGQLFVALKTPIGDGHHHMEEALARGVTGIMCTHPPTFDSSGVTVIMMRDVEGALLRWTRYVLQKYGTTLIAIAGSYGTASTREAVAQTLASRYQVYTQATEMRGRFSVPFALGGLTADHQIAVLEYNAEKPGDMAEMTHAAPPTLAVITSIARYHAKEAERETQVLLDHIDRDGVVVTNYDDPLVRQLQTPIGRLSISVDTDGTSFGADFTAYNVAAGLNKTTFDLRYDAERYLACWTPLLGAHQLYAALNAVAVGLTFQVPVPQSLQALQTLRALPGVMQPLPALQGAVLIDDSYTADPDSLTAALAWLQSVRPLPSILETLPGHISPRGRIHVVLGDVAEPGVGVNSSLPELGMRLAQVASTLITVGEQAANLARQALDQGFEQAHVHSTFSVQDALAAISAELAPKDLVLVKGSSAARMERVVLGLLANPEQDRAKLVRQGFTDDEALAEQPTTQTWIQVDMTVIARNVQRLREIIGENTRLMAVVKNDAYGHGAVRVSTTALLNGADYLGVASLDEALKLRGAGITAPILIMGHVPTHAARQLITHHLTLTLFDANLAKIFNRTAEEAGEKLRVHVRVDSGMDNLGLPPDEVPGFFRALLRLKSLELEGMYVHLDSTNARPETLHMQIERFAEVTQMMRAADFKFQLLHAADSGAALHMPESRLDMVRCGLAIYGLQPDDRYPLPEGFAPAMTWKTVVVQVKRIAAGTLVGLGGALVEAKARTIAVLPVGYQNGFRRAPHHWGEVLVKGQRAPLYGDVRAYATTIDVSHIDDVRVGDEVVLLGRQGEALITVEEAASRLGTRNFELVGSLMTRVPRF